MTIIVFTLEKEKLNEKRSDVTVAKNYLSEKEVDALNRLSNAFIDIAEQRAEDHVLMTMAD